MASGGHAVDIVVSLGVLYVTTPDVMGMPRADAKIHAARMDLSVSPGGWTGVDETPLEVLIRQKIIGEVKI